MAEAACYWSVQFLSFGAIFTAGLCRRLWCLCIVTFNWILCTFNARRTKIQALINQGILHGRHVSATKYTNTTASANTNTHDVVNQEIGQCWHVSACPGRQMTEIFDSLSLEVVNICPNTPGKMQLLFNKEKLNHICNGSGFKSLKNFVIGRLALMCDRAATIKEGINTHVICV